MTMAGELLDAGMQRDLKQLDEKLYLDVFAAPTTPERRGIRTAAVRR
jgi:hypothetical protein